MAEKFGQSFRGEHITTNHIPSSVIFGHKSWKISILWNIIYLMWTVFPLLKLMYQSAILKGALRQQSFLHPIFNSQNSNGYIRWYPQLVCLTVLSCVSQRATTGVTIFIWCAISTMMTGVAWFQCTSIYCKRDKTSEDNEWGFPQRNLVNLGNMINHK